MVLAPGEHEDGRNERGPTVLLHSRGARRLGRVGLCLASVSSILAFVGAASATAHEVSPAYWDQNGHFVVPLTPGEIPGGGDPGGQGSADLNLNMQTQQACFTANWKGLKAKSKVTAFHLHAAGPGSEGPHVIDFFNGQQLPGEDGKASGCVPATADTMRQIIGNPSAYYLNLHSDAFMKGALRGQLR